jgi:hypothetical protein
MTVSHSKAILYSLMAALIVCVIATNRPVRLGIVAAHAAEGDSITL